MKLDERQKAFLKMLGRGYLARANNNVLHWFENKPINDYNAMFLISSGSCCYIDEIASIFPDLSFIEKVSEDNTEAYSVEVLLKSLEDDEYKE